LWKREDVFLDTFMFPKNGLEKREVFLTSLLKLLGILRCAIMLVQRRVEDRDREKKTENREERIENRPLTSVLCAQIKEALQC